jgi:hypothetical protein
VSDFVNIEPTMTNGLGLKFALENGPTAIAVLDAFVALRADVLFVLTRSYHYMDCSYPTTCPPNGLITWTSFSYWFAIFVTL